jgi:hypothetical protein
VDRFGASAPLKDCRTRGCGSRVVPQEPGNGPPATCPQTAPLRKCPAAAQNERRLSHFQCRTIGRSVTSPNRKSLCLFYLKSLFSAYLFRELLANFRGRGQGNAINIPGWGILEKTRTAVNTNRDIGDPEGGGVAVTELFQKARGRTLTATGMAGFRRLDSGHSLMAGTDRLQRTPRRP